MNSRFRIFHLNRRLLDWTAFSRLRYIDTQVVQKVQLLTKNIIASTESNPHRFGITKQGNRYLRTAFVEENQRIFRSRGVGKDLKHRRKDADPAMIHIADRCMKRLVKKGSRLLDQGKHLNKVKVACAREMVGVVWESLHKVAA